MEIQSANYSKEKRTYRSIVETVVPPQRAGGQSPIDVASRLTNPTIASDVYRALKLLLLDVSDWHHFMVGITAHFWLTDRTGLETRQQAAVSDHFKIRIPGPPLQSGQGFDWTTVKAKKEIQSGTVELFYLTVVPSPNPKNAEAGTAHFLTERASTTFVVLKDDCEIRIIVCSRNELPNLRAPRRQDRIRNQVLGVLAGAYLSRFQWKKLAVALLRAGLKGVLTAENQIHLN